MNLLNALPALLIIAIFVVTAGAGLAASLRKSKYDRKISDIRDLRKKVATHEDQMNIWNELMELQSLDNTAEVKKMINEHILKYKN